MSRLVDFENKSYSLKYLCYCNIQSYQTVNENISKKFILKIKLLALRRIHSDVHNNHEYHLKE